MTTRAELIQKDIEEKKQLISKSVPNFYSHDCYYLHLFADNWLKWGAGEGKETDRWIFLKQKEHRKTFQLKTFKWVDYNSIIYTQEVVLVAT